MGNFWWNEMETWFRCTCANIYFDSLKNKQEKIWWIYSKAFTAFRNVFLNFSQLDFAGLTWLGLLLPYVVWGGSWRSSVERCRKITFLAFCDVTTTMLTAPCIVWEGEEHKLHIVVTLWQHFLPCRRCFYYDSKQRRDIILLWNCIPSHSVGTGS